MVNYTGKLISLDEELLANEISVRDMEWFYRSRVLGHTHKEMADEVGLTRQAVSAAIRKAEKAYVRSTFSRIQERKANHVMLLDHMAREVIAEWDKSKGRIEKTTKVRDGVDEDGMPIKTTETTTRELLGDVRYVAEFRQLLDKIDKVMGLEAPKETRHTGSPHTTHITQSLTIEKLEGLDEDKLEPIRAALGQLQQATRGLEGPE